MLKPEDIFLIGNPYGFRLNVYHDFIFPLYQRFKRKRGVPAIFPVDDQDRVDFEDKMIPYLEKKYGLVSPKPLEALPSDGALSPEGEMPKEKGEDAAQADAQSKSA